MCLHQRAPIRSVFDACANEGMGGEDNRPTVGDGCRGECSTFKPRIGAIQSIIDNPTRVGMTHGEAVAVWNSPSELAENRRAQAREPSLGPQLSDEHRGSIPHEIAAYYGHLVSPIVIGEWN